MGDRVIERFAELEVELRDGDEAALQPLAGPAPAEIEELVPAETSKAGAGDGGGAARARQAKAEEARGARGPSPRTMWLPMDAVEVDVVPIADAGEPPAQRALSTDAPAR